MLYGNSSISENKGILPTSLWNFAPNSGLRKFRHDKSMVWSPKLVDSRSCGFTSTTVERVHAQSLYTLVDCNPLTPLLRFVLDLLYNLFLHSSWQDFDFTHPVARSVRGSGDSCSYWNVTTSNCSVTDAVTHTRRVQNCDSRISIYRVCQKNSVYAEALILE